MLVWMFLNFSVNRLSLAHGEVEKAVRQRYMRGAAAELESRLHALIAGKYSGLLWLALILVMVTREKLQMPPTPPSPKY